MTTDKAIIDGLKRMSEEDPEGFSTDVLNLINRYETNTFVLEASLEGVREANAILREHIGALEATIERLQEENIILSQKRANFFEIVNANERGRTRGIKEFAERLKEESSFETDVSLGYGRPCYEDAVPIIAIDNLVKEMVGENNV